MQNTPLQFDKIQKFLDVLDPNRKEWFFQAFPGADFFKGTLKEAESFLDRHNTHEEGIYFMPNEWELEGLEIPKNEHIIRSNLLFIDIDRKHTIPDEFHVEPSLVVQTNAQGQQIYWKTDEDIAPLDQYTPLQKNLISRYGSDTAIHDPRRLMRLPFTWNCKYEEPHLVTVEKANKGKHKIMDVAVPEIETHEIIDLPFSDSAIDLFNKENEISNILLRNNYEQKGERFLAPGSTSGVPGVSILDNAVWSNHASCPLNDQKKHDAFDCMRILEHGGDWNLAKKSLEVSEVPKVTKLIGYNVHEFIALNLPPREYIIEDFMAKGDLHMIYGDTGHGKSVLTHYLAQCLSAGVDFGPYKIKDSRKVLLIDGEMPAVTLQDKWKQKYHFLEKEEVFQSYGYNLTTVSAMLQPNGMEPFNTPSGRQSFWDCVNELNPEVVMFDNLLTLFAMEDTNRGEEWTIHVQPMLLELRKRNIAVWMCHHAGKNGTQYGTMAKTIMLDVILKIEHEVELGSLGIDTTSFKWSFEKGRHIFGKSIQPIVWTYSDSDMKWDKVGKENKKELCIELLRQGKSQVEISKETGLSTSQVSRYLKGVKVGTTI